MLVKYCCGCIGLPLRRDAAVGDDPNTRTAVTWMLVDCCTDRADQPDAEHVPHQRSLTGKQSSCEPLSPEEVDAVFKKLASLAADGIRFRQLQSLLQPPAEE